MLISHTPSMDAFKLRYCLYVVLAMTVGDGEQTMTPTTLPASMEQRCGVVPSELVIEVACPSHELWLTFSMEEKCTDVLLWSMKI